MRLKCFTKLASSHETLASNGLDTKGISFRCSAPFSDFTSPCNAKDSVFLACNLFCSPSPSSSWVAASECFMHIHLQATYLVIFYSSCKLAALCQVGIFYADLREFLMGITFVSNCMTSKTVISSKQTKLTSLPLSYCSTFCRFK